MTNDQHRRREKLKNKLREIELVREHEEIRESRSLRRTCYAELNRDARQFNTALNRHLQSAARRTPTASRSMKQRTRIVIGTPKHR
ncbi:hypothetical protein [Streptomyces sp. NPDC005167]